MDDTFSQDYKLAHSHYGIPFAQPLIAQGSIIDHLIERSRTSGDQPYITTVAGNQAGVTWSYRDIDTLSRRLAYWCQHNVGIQPGDTCAVLPVNDITSVVTIFGLLRSGCSILLLNPTSPLERLREQIGAINIKEVFRVPAVASDVMTDAILVPDPLLLSNEQAANAQIQIQPTDDALLFGTSGSTASSKLVVQSHYNATINAEAVRHHHALKPGDKLLGCLPIYHVNGLHFTIFATLAAGSHAILAYSFEPFGYQQLIARYKPRIASVVPSILEALLGAWRQPNLPQEFQYFVSAAAPLSVGTARAVAEKLNTRVMQGYGLTETTNFSTKMPAHISPNTYRRLMIDVEIPSIGTAMYGNEVNVINTNGNYAKPGEIGEICIRGHNVMTRYEGNPSATAEAFRDGWFHSQDLGFRIDDAESGESFFFITGRIKNIAKVRGEAVSLDEMDRTLRALPQIKDAASVAIPHRLLGDEITVAVVLFDESSLTDSDIRAHLQKTFPPIALPRRIVRLQAIPRTMTGKILRPELAQQLATHTD